MPTTSDREVQIERLRQNLSSIRRIAGWSTAVLGEKIGVTKQTISNLEKKKTPMSFTQYIAIRSVIDAEIESQKDNEVLKKVVALLLDSDDFDEDEYIKLQEVAETVAATAAGGAPKVKLNDLLDLLIASLPFIVGIIGALSVNWSKKVLK